MCHAPLTFVASLNSILYVHMYILGIFTYNIKYKKKKTFLWYVNSIHTFYIGTFIIVHKYGRVIRGKAVKLSLYVS